MNNNLIFNSLNRKQFDLRQKKPLVWRRKRLTAIKEHFDKLNAQINQTKEGNINE